MNPTENDVKVALDTLVRFYGTDETITAVNKLTDGSEIIIDVNIKHVKAAE